MIDPLSINIPIGHGVLEKTPPRPRRYLLKPTDTPGDYLMELSYSSLSEFIICPKRGENLLIHARKGQRSPIAMSFGQCFHRLEELRLRHGWSGETRHLQLETISRWFLENPVPPEEYRNADRMAELITKYNRRYAHPGVPLFDDWPRKVVQYEGAPFIERPFKLPLVSIPVNSTIPPEYHHTLCADTPVTQLGTIHVILTGIIDTVISEAGLLWVVDHKTTSRGGSEFLSAFRLSLQTRLYVLFLHSIGLPVHGLYLNGVICRKPTKTGTDLDWERHPFPYSPDLLEDARTSLISACEDLLHCLTRGSFPQTSLSFRSPCSGCAYHDNCCLPRAQRAADLASDVYETNEVSHLDDASSE